MKTFEAKAPGKILLLGGYSVLERPNVAYVLSVDAYAHAKIKPREDEKIIIKMPQFKVKIQTDTHNILSLPLEDKNKFALSAVKCSLQYMQFLDAAFSGFELETKSDKAFSVEKGKSGLGSSAAVTVAVVKAIFEAFGIDGSKPDEVHKVAQLAHALAQGKVGSGFDVAASCYGSMAYVRYSPEKLAFNNSNKSFSSVLDCEIKKTALCHGFYIAYASFPNESMPTAKAVLKVMEFKSSAPERYRELMKELDRENRLAIEAKTMDAFKEYFERGRMITKLLGELAGVEIEPEKYSALIEETKENGAFVAKLPGAGGGDAIVALCLGEKDSERVRKFWKKKGLNILNVNLLP